MKTIPEMRHELQEAGFTFDQISNDLYGVYTADGELIQIYRNNDTEAVETAYRRLERQCA